MSANQNILDDKCLEPGCSRILSKPEHQREYQYCYKHVYRSLRGGTKFCSHPRCRNTSKFGDDRYCNVHYMVYISRFQKKVGQAENKIPMDDLFGSDYVDALDVNHKDRTADTKEYLMTRGIGGSIAARVGSE